MISTTTVPQDAHAQAVLVELTTLLLQRLAIMHKITFFLKNWISRQIAQNRQIAKPSKRLIGDFLGMLHT